MDKSNLEIDLKVLVKDADALEQLFSDYYGIYIKDEFSEVQVLSEVEEQDAKAIKAKMDAAIKSVVNDIVKLAHGLHQGAKYVEGKVNIQNKRLVRLAGHLYNTNILYHGLEEENLNDDIKEIHDVFTANIATLDAAIKKYNANCNQEEMLYDIVTAKNKYIESLQKNNSSTGLPT